ncbi:hypothetical protein JCM10212_005152 [Sporobolomyces blumeae]
MSDWYEGHLLDAPTDAEYDEFVRRQQLAAAEPLEVGDVLTWAGPSLERDVSPPTDYPHARSTSPNPPRPIHRALLDVETGPTSKPWTLKLVEGLQTGVDQRSQVWRVKARPCDDPQTVVPVVFKLRHGALFPLPRSVESDPPSDSWNWFSAAYLQEREALAYRTAHDLQGTDLRICYGFFKFRLPNGVELVGLVLENLVDSDRAACAALLLQRRIHRLGLSGFVLIQPRDFAYPRRPYDQREAPLVGLGFGKATTKQRIERAYLLSRGGGESRGGPRDRRWYGCWDAQYGLFYSWSAIFESHESKWVEMVRRWWRVGRDDPTLEFLDGMWKMLVDPEPVDEADLQIIW